MANWYSDGGTFRAKVGKHFSLEVIKTAPKWRWNARAEHVALAWGIEETKEDAKRECEAALRKALADASQSIGV